MLLFLLVAATALYVTLAVGSAVVAARGERASLRPLDPDAKLSILVAARDEAEKLPRCLEALRQQRGLPAQTEFLIANDGSSDATPDVIDAFARGDARFRRLDVPEATGRLRGKAHALHHAYRHASGDLFLITDADCAPPPDWAASLAAALAAPDVGVACGVALVEHRTLFESVQALDWLLGLTVASAAARLGVPLTAMGNNMAFRRGAYEDVGGYPALPPSVTEDCALFQAVHRTSRWRVRLLLDERLRTWTSPLHSLGDVFRQRKRWASGGLQAAPRSVVLYALVFLVHARLLAGLIVVPTIALLLLFLKAFADLLVLGVAGRRMDVRLPLRAFPLFEIYLFGYVLLMPFALLFTPAIAWKGRSW
ncbi:MAG: glycosyltransferase [Rhodothermales bacterium]